MDAYERTLTKLWKQDQFYKVWFSSPAIIINAAFKVKETELPKKLLEGETNYSSSKIDLDTFKTK